MKTKRNLAATTMLLVRTDRIMALCHKNNIHLPAPAEGYVQALFLRGVLNNCKSDSDIVSRIKELL